MASQAVAVPDQPGLYIGGLRHDLHPAKLAGLVCSLLGKFQVQVAKHHVHITFKSNEAFAIVDLPDVSVSHHLLSQLSALHNVHNVFDLNKITADPSNFKVGPKLTRGYRSRSRSRSKHNEKSDMVSVPVRVISGTTQHSSSNHSVDSADKYRSRSRSDKRNGGERQGTQSASNAVVTSSSSHSAEDVGKPSKSKRASRRERKRNRSKLHEANASRSGSSVSVLQNQSNTSQQTLKFAQHISEEEEDDDNDDDSATSDSENDSSPESSNFSLLKRETALSKANSSGTSVLRPGARPQAGGVRRLMQEISVDPVSRSASERGIYSLNKTSTTTSTTGLPLPSLVSVTTSTPGVGTGLVSNFYRQGQTIGRETRHSEFKQGGKAKERTWLLETVGKYVCGFLNSTEGGTLYIGVNDNGIATGIPCPQSKEDDYRLLIDDALKSIDPPIFTDVYTVRFVPLMEANGFISDSLQVLEVEVREMRNSNQLYVFRGDAFLRRDGSLQGPLKARQVQEWTRKRLERDNSSSLLKSQLREMTSQLQSERKKTERMEQELAELQGQVSEVKLEHKKSKICAVM